MQLIYRGYSLNLSLYHKFFVVPNQPLRIMFEIRAGGMQEGNGREIFEFDTQEDRDEAFDLINAAIATGADAFDIQGHWDDMAEQIHGSVNTIQIVCCRCGHVHAKEIRGLVAFLCDGCGHSMCKVCWETAGIDINNVGSENTDD